MKKALVILLVCLTFCPGFASCGGQNDPAGTDIPETSEDIASTVEDRPDLPSAEEMSDISGEFNILVSGNYAWNDFQAESDNGTPTESAIYRRNAYMKETYNVDIVNHDVIKFNSANGSGVGYNTIYTDYMSGTYNYDAAIVGTYDVSTLAYNGYLYDLGNIPYLNLQKDYWDQKANQDLTINGKLYYTTGDITVIDNMLTHVLLFNKEMIKAYELDDPYTLVRSGNWTWETFSAWVRSVGEDANQDGVRDSNDIYGLLTWNDGCLAVLASAGEKICSINAQNQIELTFYNERVVNLYDMFTALVYDNSHVFNYQYDYINGTNSKNSTWNPTRQKMFDSDQALFHFNLLTAVAKHRDSETDFGILPYPKYDVQQADYGHMVSAFHCGFVCVPEMSKNFERTGIILEELSYQGKKLLTPAYYDQTLVGQYTRDEESVDMLDIIFSTRVFDVGIYYNIGTYKEQLAGLFRNRQSISSIYETYRNSAETKIKEINTFFTRLGN